MPRISLWKSNKDHDYHFNDRILRDYINQGGTGIYVHKYLGPATGGDETTIGDILFLENRNRKYSDHIYEMRGAYTPESSEFDLSQFGIFISNDTIFILFHYTDMLNTIGRKLMAGDVLELPHMVDPDTLTEERGVTKRFYSVQDAMHASEGYGNRWWSHLWRVKAKMIVDSPEYSGLINGPVDENTMPYGPDVGIGAGNAKSSGGSIIGPEGEVIGDACCYEGSTSAKDQAITDGIIDEAYSYVRFDPKWFDDAHLYIHYVDRKWEFYPWTGDGLPPNGYPLLGDGNSFPEDAQDGDYYLRSDYVPERMFQKEGNVWKYIETDWRKDWTAYNKVLDTFIDNRGTDVMTDGSVKTTKKALSKTVSPRENLHQAKEGEIFDSNGNRIK